MCCYQCQTSDDENTKTISGICSSGKGLSNCSKIGDGAAKITYLN